MNHICTPGIIIQLLQLSTEFRLASDGLSNKAGKSHDVGRHFGKLASQYRAWIIK
jgi:hypothetical protein